jgi:hypothetical protein
VVVEIFNFKAGGFIWQMGCALRGSVHVTGLTRSPSNIFCAVGFRDKRRIYINKDLTRYRGLSVP